MSWIAEYDTQGREFPTCVHVTKTTGTMTHGATYVPIEDGKAVRAENAKLRELLKDTLPFIAEESGYCVTADCFVYPACCDYDGDEECPAVARIHERARELGVEA